MLDDDGALAGGAPVLLARLWFSFGSIAFAATLVAFVATLVAFAAAHVP
jgi:hypothetical protein